MLNELNTRKQERTRENVQSFSHISGKTKKCYRKKCPTILEYISELLKKQNLRISTKKTKIISFLKNISSTRCIVFLLRICDPFLFQWSWNMFFSRIWKNSFWGIFSFQTDISNNQIASGIYFRHPFLTPLVSNTPTHYIH